MGNLATASVHSAEDTELAGFVVELLRSAGVRTMDRQISRSWRHAHDRGVVTPVDLEIEELLLSAIATRFPDHSVLTEEQGEIARHPDHLWLIDPIDGTVNFARGLDDYCITLAYLREGAPVVTAIYRPRAEEMFLAVRDRSPTRNGEPARAGRAADPAVVIGTGFSTASEVRGRQRELIGNLVRAGVEIREPGSASLGIARVAAGMYDGYVEEGLGPWDVVPGAFMVERAGGVVTDWTGRPLAPRPSSVIAASSAAVHELLRDAVDG